MGVAWRSGLMLLGGGRVRRRGVEDGAREREGGGGAGA